VFFLLWETLVDEISQKQSVTKYSMAANDKGFAGQGQR
jgi:hypothetical protein